MDIKKFCETIGLENAADMIDAEEDVLMDVGGVAVLDPDDDAVAVSYQVDHTHAQAEALLEWWADWHLKGSQEALEELLSFVGELMDTIAEGMYGGGL